MKLLREMYSRQLRASNMGWRAPAAHGQLCVGPFNYQLKAINERTLHPAKDRNL